MADTGPPERLERIIGLAAISLWSDLDRQVQERLFEQTVRIGKGEDPNLRQRLAQFLHEHHARTARA